MELQDKIRQLRLEKGMTLEEVGKKVGVGKSTVRKWESGDIKNMRRDKIALLARALDVSPAYLMGWSENKHSQPVPPPNIVSIKRYKIPILGHIAAGVPIMAEQEFDTYADVGEDLRADFGLIVDGDSMEPTIKAGDLVFIRKQEDVEDGEIAAVIIDDAATLKHVYHIPGGVQLVSENPKYSPQIYTSDNSDYLAILGKAISFKRIL